MTNTVSGEVSNFTYDAAGQRVKRTDASGMTVYVGAYFEVQVTAGISTSYYAFGGQRVAMRQGASVYWIHGDHPLRRAAGTVGLDSASLVTSITGTVVSEVRYRCARSARRAGWTGLGIIHE